MKIIIPVLLLAFTLCGAEEGFAGKSVTQIKDENTTCVVRMLDTKRMPYPRFAAAIVYKNGKKEFFSSAKFMLRRYYGHEKGVESIYVSDYKNAKFIKPEEGYYVFGSRIMSAGGDDLIVFSSEADAREFGAQNGGKKILRFNEISKKLIELLDMR